MKFTTEQKEIINDFVNTFNSVCSSVEDDNCEKCPFYEVCYSGFETTVDIVDLLTFLIKED